MFRFKLNSQWQSLLADEIQKPYFFDLMKTVDEEYQTQVCFPPKELIFAAFDYCSFEDLKVVIIGQDPYHGVGEANGLCFSVNENVKIPPSLRNIFREMTDDLGTIFLPTSGNLEHWAKQGVLLLNASLTVIFLIAEITGGYNLMIPLMIVSSISFAISKRFEKYSLDVKNLAKKGHAFTSNKDTNILSTLDTNSIIHTDYLTVSPDENLERLVDLISHSNQVIFAVVDTDNQMRGIVHFNDIREIIFNVYRVKFTLVKEIMKAPKEIISPNDSMEMVMNKFEKSKKVFLPVLKNDKYYGFISKSEALEAYRTKLKSMTID